MGWENYHLFEFNFYNHRITEIDEDFDDFGYGRDRVLEASKVTLESMIIDSKMKFHYMYDFGDGWRHKITMEKFLPRDNKLKYPTCTKGQLNCPQEDCGGIPGYCGLLEILANKRHPERKDMLEWLGGLYDPEQFDLAEVNEALENLADYLE